ncbi:MAG: hypothetical protein H6741_11585 [Alphaproteobacteria bacterium]|nr:hypothetical protein [Alphaproteobacteria bacterium]
MTTPLLLILLSACDKKDADTETAAPAWTPDLFCPGDPSGACESASGALQVGAAVTSISPPCLEAWIDENGDERYAASRDSFLDCGCDRLCEGDEGYPGPDEGEGDGEFNTAWIAGFSQGRPAQGVHDDVEARAIVLDQGDTRLAIVSIDVVGFFHDEVLRIREGLDPALGVDHVILTSTHTHEGPDTMGMWGPAFGRSGVQPEYNAFVRDQVTEAISLAVGGLTPVDHMVLGSADPAAAHERGQANLQRDSRDPVIIVDEVGAAAFYDAQGQVIATLVSWGSHPEVLSDDNLLISADFSHYLREAVEQGVSWETAQTDGLGGVCIFLQGMVGGLMTPLGVTVHDPDGNEWSEASWDKARALGWLVGELALSAVAEGQVVEAPELGFAQSLFKLPVDNIGFQAMFRIDVLPREIYDFDETQDVDDDNLPHVLTEVDWVQIGPLRLLTVPGELVPEVAIGGYDGSKVGTDLYELIDPNNPNPPDLSAAPEGPYLRDLLGGEANWIVGLGNDELGYIIPAYDFILHPDSPYIAEAEGDHYEETNSLGPETEPLISEQSQLLLGWAEEHAR